jgi:hypothetical protein
LERRKVFGSGNPYPRYKKKGGKANLREHRGIFSSFFSGGLQSSLFNFYSPFPSLKHINHALLNEESEQGEGNAERDFRNKSRFTLALVHHFYDRLGGI